MGHLGDIRRQHSVETASRFFEGIKLRGVYIDSIIQCGLGDWAEGPAILKYFQNVPMMAVEPIHRYAVEAWAAGFRGPIVQAALGPVPGSLRLNDWRTRTSVIDNEDHGLGSFETSVLRLDDVVEYIGFKSTAALLWMDVEGSEILVMDGAVDVFQKTEVVIIELSAKKPRAGWPTREDKISKLARLNFELIDEHRNDGLFIKKWQA